MCVLAYFLHYSTFFLSLSLVWLVFCVISWLLLVWLSVPVQSIAWNDSYPKLPVMYHVGATTDMHSKDCYRIATTVHFRLDFPVEFS